MPPRRRTGAVHMRLHREGRKRLAKLLLIQEISHRRLADELGWKSHGMVSHLISGRRAGVRTEQAVAMAKLLGVEVSDLFLTEIPTNRGPQKVVAGTPVKKVGVGR